MSALQDPAGCKTLWRGSLLPLECAALPLFGGRFATQWEQAPSPQGAVFWLAIGEERSALQALRRKSRRVQNIVARELAPAGVRSAPAFLGPLRDPTGASSLATGERLFGLPLVEDAVRFKTPAYTAPGARHCGEGACSRWSAQRSRFLGAASRPSGSKLPRHRGAVAPTGVRRVWFSERFSSGTRSLVGPPAVLPCH